MKDLLITRPLPDDVLAAARAQFSVTVRLNNLPMQADELRDALRNFDLVLPTLGDAFDARVFADVGTPRTKMLANFGVGFNHIDTQAAKAAGVVVTNTPGAVTDATADVAMTLMLMSARRAGEGERLVRSGQWRGWHPTQMLGLHLSGKTVGIVGMGRIGQAIAARCHFGFGMAVKYWNRSEKDLPFPADRVAELTELAGQVDVLVAAVPGGADTQHLFDAEVFDAMPKHAHFINISRGEVVQEAALIAALQAEEIGGAGLDVYEFEPKVPEALRKLENVTLLPHLGTAALEVRRQMGMMAVDNLIAFDRGQTPPNLV
ncbi:2-hydroxyacid dehydrogenase [Shimia sp. MMG029]|uniref:2-hydroxyacid dehydrogenase n=1 Tax=Shimia sp. MMG029 TaxID=3021978 RepID=UPI0022FDCEC5|nr:D-glycerate dehydrogenase [Shimia sp. MMG029]MDA5557125.1 D-glycerate dehydrogenase [Shimia sp. MMG029]